MFNRFYLVVIFGLLAIFFSTQSRTFQSNLLYRKRACIVLCIFFIIQAGFRDYLNQMTDTINYANSYFELQSISFDSLLKNSSLITNNYGNRDPGYKIFVKLTQLITKDFQLYLVIVATIISVPLCRIIYKYSTSLPGVLIAACLYEALFESFFETGIRQTIAMGFSFVALECYQKRKYALTVLLTVSAYLIHTTALIFIPIYFILRYCNEKRILSISILMAPVFMYFAQPILAYVGDGTIMENYTSLLTTDNKGTPVFSAMVFFAAIITSYLSERIRRVTNNYELMFGTMACAIMLTPATWVNSNFLRIVLYYLVFLMPLLSIIVDAFTRNIKVKSTQYYMIIAFVLSYLTYNA